MPSNWMYFLSHSSTAFYNPWMASFVVALGLATAIVSFSVGKRRWLSP